MFRVYQNQNGKWVVQRLKDGRWLDFSEGYDKKEDAEGLKKDLEDEGWARAIDVFSSTD